MNWRAANKNSPDRQFAELSGDNFLVCPQPRGKETIASMYRESDKRKSKLGRGREHLTKNIPLERALDANSGLPMTLESISFPSSSMTWPWMGARGGPHQSNTTERGAEGRAAREWRITDGCRIIRTCIHWHADNHKYRENPSAPADIRVSSHTWLESVEPARDLSICATRPHRLRRTPMCNRTILTQRPAELRHERNSHHPTPLWHSASRAVRQSVETRRRHVHPVQNREPVHDARCAMSTAAPRRVCMYMYPARLTSEAADDQSPGARMFGPHVRRPADSTSYSSRARECRGIGGGTAYRIPSSQSPALTRRALWLRARGSPRSSAHRIASPRAAPSPSPYEIRVWVPDRSQARSAARWGGIASKGGKRKGDEGEGEMGTQARVIDGSIEKGDEGRWTRNGEIAVEMWNRGWDVGYAAGRNAGYGWVMGKVRAKDEWANVCTVGSTKKKSGDESGISAERGEERDTAASTGRGGGDRSKKSPDGPQPAVEIAAPISQMSGERGRGHVPKTEVAEQGVLRLRGR
ncbi:hypothetical protein B0H13DRAFT_2299040 [Mycena leptocephala]|nr:hypothetical protein B0H13DRAFT_2299040 [Mycena leptocephala]